MKESVRECGVSESEKEEAGGAEANRLVYLGQYSKRSNLIDPHDRSQAGDAGGEGRVRPHLAGQHR